MSESYEATSTSLLMRVKDNDARAWERLVRLYSPLIGYWCSQRKLQATDTEEVLQEVFGAVTAAVDTFQLHQGSFRGWLRTITNRKISDLFRKRRRNPEAQGGTDGDRRLSAYPEPSEDPSGFIEIGDLQQEQNVVCRQGLELVRREFQDSAWQAFWLVTVDDCAPVDVAMELGITVNMVYKAKSRILNRLRQELAGLFD